MTIYYGTFKQEIDAVGLDWCDWAAPLISTVFVLIKAETVMESPRMRWTNFLLQPGTGTDDKVKDKVCVRKSRRKYY